MMRTLALGLSLLLAASFAHAKEPLFLMHVVDRTETESVHVMDFNKDGKPDIGAAQFWYEGPEWVKRDYLSSPTAEAPFRTNAQLPLDVDKDGNTDVIFGRWGASGIWYFRNPGTPGAKWDGEKITDTAQLECLMAEDVDGDGNLDILPSFWADQPYYWLKIENGKFVKRPVGPNGVKHGLGFADLNGDGKKDIMTGSGWFEQVDLAADKWTYHPDFTMIHEASIPMYASDLNEDGLMDVIYGEGHDYGLFWLEQKMTGDKREWVRHEIDPTYSQLHVVLMADINGDGKDEIITGKRYRAHNDGDPGAFDPSSVTYYTVEKGKEPKFQAFPLAFNSLAGVGTQGVIADLDGDGDTDLVFGGKAGQYWFENLSVNNVPKEKRDVMMNRFPTKL